MRSPQADSERPTIPERQPSDPGRPGSPTAPLTGLLAPDLAAESRDERLLRRAVVVAVLFHAVLFFVELPQSGARTEIEAPERHVYALRQDRFRPPEPDRPRELPQPRSRRVPVPDPTPADPEPLRTTEPEAFDLVVPEDVVFAVPESAPEPARDPGPVRLTPEMARPVKLHAPMPEYTEAARRARIQGIVILEAVIDVDGSVREVEVLRTLPMGLGEAAARAVEGWRYRPATLDERPIAVILTVTVDFRLH